MNEKEKALTWLRNTLNSMAQNGISKISKNDLSRHLDFGYLSTDSGKSLNVKLSWIEIGNELRELEKIGVLNMLKEPNIACNEDICVKLNTFISGTPFPSGWIRD